MVARQTYALDDQNWISRGAITGVMCPSGVASNLALHICEESEGAHRWLPSSAAAGNTSQVERRSAAIPCPAILNLLGPLVIEEDSGDHNTLHML